MVAHVTTVAPVGFDASLIEVECDASNSLPALQIVGLSNKAINEARERIRSAITNSLLTSLKNALRSTLRPLSFQKMAHTMTFLALSILTIGSQLRQEEPIGAIFAGELALDGTIRPIKGALTLLRLLLFSLVS
jgi:magnesium chelatase family protein